MKKILLIFWVFFTPAIGFAQFDLAFKTQDAFFINHGAKGLKIGDKMPDIPFGTILNNSTGKTHFSELKGKVVILDFWSTSCTTCIANFPMMSHMQEEFADKIQIILVNLGETQQQIDQTATNRGRTNPKFSKFKTPENLPSIVQERPISNIEDYWKGTWQQYFPLRGVPFHVWIDQNGTISVMGGHENTYPDKIRDLLLGKGVFSLGDLNTTPGLLDNPKLPYYKLLGDMDKVPLVFGTFITPYNNFLDAGSTTGAIIRNSVDTSSKTLRNTLVNVDLLKIYSFGPFKDQYSREIQRNHICYFPNSNGLVILPKGIDTLKLTSEYLADYRTAKKSFNDNDLIDLRDFELVGSTYSYEQIVPMNMEQAEIKERMLTDLNTYFKYKIGLTAQLEKRNVPCYVLVRSSTTDNISSKSNYLTPKVLFKNKAAYTQFTRYPLNNVIDDAIGTSSSGSKLSTIMRQNQMAGKASLILNETGWNDDKEVDMLIPENISSINDFKRMLNSYGLDLVEKNREIEFIVFKKAL